MTTLTTSEEIFEAIVNRTLMLISNTDQQTKTIIYSETSHEKIRSQFKAKMTSHQSRPSLKCVAVSSL